jgi:hypothetical protein
MLLQRSGRNPRAMSAREVLRLATRGGAINLGEWRSTAATSGENRAQVTRLLACWCVGSVTPLGYILMHDFR